MKKLEPSPIFLVEPPIIFIRNLTDYPNVQNKVREISEHCTDITDMELGELEHIIVALYLDGKQVPEIPTKGTLENEYYKAIQGFLFIRRYGKFAALSNLCFDNNLRSFPEDAENPVARLISQTLTNLDRKKVAAHIELPMDTALWFYYLNVLSRENFQIPVVDVSKGVKRSKIKFIRNPDANVVGGSKFITTRGNREEFLKESDNIRAKFLTLTKSPTPSSPPSEVKLVFKSPSKGSDISKKYGKSKKYSLVTTVEDLTTSSGNPKSIKARKSPYNLTHKESKIDISSKRILKPSTFLESLTSNDHPIIDINMRACHEGRM